LLERKQRVNIKGYASAWMNVLSGVPQGSILGPLLFILQINDPTEILDSNSYLYADD
jgi:ribonucleases P/MRP protein subunit RPP40